MLLYDPMRHEKVSDSRCTASPANRVPLIRGRRLLPQDRQNEILRRIP